jgi:hypothetical protein
MEIMTDWPYHEYRGKDPKKTGTFVKCHDNPCSIHGDSDIMASSPEEAYEKAHEDDGSLGMDKDGLTMSSPEEIAALHAVRTANNGYVSGSNEWYDVCKDDFLHDDGSMLVESYDEMLLEQYGDYTNTVMDYISLYMQNGDVASIPYGANTPFTEREAKQMVVFTARDNPDSRLYNMDDEHFAHIIYDPTALENAFNDAYEDNLFEKEEYEDYDAVEKHKQDDEDYEPYDRIEDMYYD